MNTYGSQEKKKTTAMNMAATSHLRRAPKMVSDLRLNFSIIKLNTSEKNGNFFSKFSILPVKFVQRFRTNLKLRSISCFKFDVTEIQSSFPRIALSVTTIMAAKPTHQTAGFPITEIVESMLFGRYVMSNHLGTNIKGQLHHAEAN